MSTTTLQEQLTAAQAAFDAALEAGEPTRSHREAITRLEAELATAQRTEAAASSQQIADEAAVLALSHAASIEDAGTVAELEALSAAPIAEAIECDPLLASAALDVIKARKALAQASSVHGELCKAVDKLRHTISQKQANLASILGRRAAGTATADDGLEALGLPQDIADLEVRLAAASAEAAAAVPAVLQGELAAAEKRLSQTRGTVGVRIASDRLARAEQLFLALYAELRAAERASGQYEFRPSGDYRANPEIKRIISRH
ncbi:hypothetical protein [Methylobacterium soli]|uniref:Uncharacterized protein n=1 Tax=Methylobacterium soli TaxID=553447 RepID=A0A6L3SSB4_9HYPH|nr:hypothetical protein [Methylobacterium soli]KAB1075941.1 hypothetical protein F6X53_24235 [Methylobacterium soli]GJE46135.1 hypothetical protein AEGHOMDF_5335 [Methylobacterium soli]